MTIISTASPLWKLPSGLQSRQATSFDAIRLSVQFIDVAYERLIGTLNVLSLTTDRALQLGPNALMDAWAIVDGVHRLRTLVHQLPGYRDRSPSKRIFMGRTESVEGLRNSLQHLVSELREITDSDLPVLGALTWIKPLDAESGRMEVNSFMPGQLRSVHPTSWVTVPREVPAEIDQIELWHAEKVTNVSSIHRAVRELAHSLEVELLGGASLTTAAPCDAMLSIVVEVVPDESVTG